MKLYGVRVWVDDMAAARNFYRDILGLAEQWAMDEAVGYDLGATLIVEQAAADDRDHVGRFVGLSILVDDIDRAYADLVARGVEFVGPPEKQAWGGTLPHFKDKAGNVLTLLG